MITVKVQSKGEEVFILQRLLRKVGYVIAVDGDFGSNTNRAVRDFQFSQSLIADGVVNDLTWEILFKKSFKNGEDPLGTDVYQHDSTDDESFWEEVRTKYFFCYAKSSEGSSWNDPKFKEHIKKLEYHQILRGGYHFFRMLNDDVNGQIRNFLDSGLNYRQKGVLPPVLDLEPTTREWNNISVLIENRVAIAKRLKKWLVEVEHKTGKRPIIYTSKEIWENILQAPAGFGHYPLWLANYSPVTKPTVPMGWTNYTIWQFTEEGVIGGKSGFDINRVNLPLPELLTMAGF